MPILARSAYRPPPLLGNGHLQTILPFLLRRVGGTAYRRERIATPDRDFIDLDWSRCGSRHLVVLCHGLEGSSRAVYMRGMTRAFNRAGWDAVAYNYRGCSGAVNRRLRAYHSGATGDLDRVQDHIAATRRYDSIGLIGFSLGGNLVLKYLGENRPTLSGVPHWGAAVSVPCDLEAGARRLDRAANRIYSRRFLKTLKAKALLKARWFPGRLDADRIAAVQSVKAFDDLYTAPVHGFRDAEDYYRRCSARRFLNRIRVPALILNARNDPFLDAGCFPLAEAHRSNRLFLEMPPSGGHVGFIPRGLRGPFWHEARVLRFARDHAPLKPSPPRALRGR